jgi:hypothetical protein
LGQALLLPNWSREEKAELLSILSRLHTHTPAILHDDAKFETFQHADSKQLFLKGSGRKVMYIVQLSIYINESSI